MEDAVHENLRKPIFENLSPGFKAAFKLRATGLLYLALGYIFIRGALLLAVFPGIFNINETRYIVPHACDLLECQHGYLRGPDGELYCSKYPPKEILEAGISQPIKKTRLIIGAVFGISGLVFALSVCVCGFVWLLGLWKPRKPACWYTVLCRLAPVIVILFWTAACISKAIYPIRGPG